MVINDRDANCEKSITTHGSWLLMNCEIHRKENKLISSGTTTLTSKIKTPYVIDLASSDRNRFENRQQEDLREEFKQNNMKCYILQLVNFSIAENTYRERQGLHIRINTYSPQEYCESYLSVFKYCITRSPKGYKFFPIQ